MQLIQETQEHGILRLMLNDNARRNALSMDMLGQLQAALDQAAGDPTVRVIVLAATGPAFSAGHDLKEMTRAREASDGGKDFFVETMATCAQVMQTIVNHPKPVIAEITGVATAAGCQLVASCDLAYAALTARFGTPGVNIGVVCESLTYGVRTKAMDHIQHTRWDSRLQREPGPDRRRCWAVLGRLEYHRVSPRQCRSDFPCAHHERKVPRRNSDYYAGRIMDRVRVIPGVHWVSVSHAQASVIGEESDVPRAPCDVVQGLSHRFPHIECVGQGEFLRVLVHQVSEPV